MLPSTFPQSNRTLAPPPAFGKPCSALQVYTDGEMCLSCWRPTWRERLSMLIFGRVWVFVWFGSSQPPIALSGVRTVFPKEAGAAGGAAEDTQ